MPGALQGLTRELGFKRRDDKAAYDRAWRAKNREKYNEYSRAYHQDVVKIDPEKYQAKLDSGRWSRRKKKYGILKEEYYRLLEKQEGKCYICQEYHGEELRVDHDHDTKRIRSLLCNNCNTGIGMFHEDPSRMQKAIDYLVEQKELST